MCSSFKQESWQGIHNLPVDTIKMALYTATARTVWTLIAADR